MKLWNAFIAACTAFSFSSCGLFGIHLKVHNPRHPGTYPAFDQETILLGALSPLRQSFDVTFYDLDINIDAANKELGGWVAVTAKALQDIDSIQLDLDQPLALKAVSWKTRDGSPLKYTRSYRAVYIHLPSKVRQGDYFTVHVQYGGQPVIAKKAPWQGGLVWKKDKDKNDWAGVACESEGASIWFPCKDHTADEPDSARMRFSIPESQLMVVSNGILENIAAANGRKYFSWSVHNPINLYNITFYVGNFEKIEDSYTGIDGRTLEINHYALKRNAEKAKVHFASVKDQIRVYEELYGPYAWYNDGFKLVESPYAGMEHQTAIAYGNGYKKDLEQVEDYIILHETGHEWFGNAITAADLADVWLQEGITTYGEVLYLEKKYGTQLARKHLNFYKIMIANKRPVVGPRDKRFFDYKDGDVYVKGAWILHSLRNTINDDSTFFKILRTFYSNYQKRTTDSKAFIETVNATTGSDYNWFFNQYLYKNTAPFLEYEQGKNGHIYYRWTDAGADFNKLKVSFELSNGKQVQVTPATEVQQLDISGEGNVSVFIDNSTALFGTRKNNKLHTLLKD